MLQSSEESSEPEIQSEDGSEVSEDDTSDAPAHSYGQLQQESDDEDGNFDFDCESDSDEYEGDSEFSEASSISEDMGSDSDSDGSGYRRHISSKPKRGVNVQKGVLTVYDLESREPTRLLRISKPLSMTLYSSPAVIHPTQPLIVWPLCGGDILFADLGGKTYFIRKSRPTTKRSKSPFSTSSA